MTVITVSQLNIFIKSLLDGTRQLNNVYVVGEISNFLHYARSGHMYFTLKDERSQLKAVMFSSNATRVRFKLEDGMRVICRGRVSVYDKDGTYQLYVDDVQPDGAGTLAIAFEQLKKKLQQEGLFDDAHKKVLPSYPLKIGVATSDVGAAVEDIKNITNRRWPLCELVISPTIVQGDYAPESIVKSIQRLDNQNDIDLIIVGRGGGSLEDLWAFNTEPVAQAVYNCNKPIISAVGHETDFTICDFVADLRAPTPSAAAELAVPDKSILNDYVDSLKQSLYANLVNKINYEYQRLDFLVNESAFASPKNYINQFEQVLNDNICAMNSAFKFQSDHRESRLSIACTKLNALSPLAVIQRGYSIVKKDNEFIKSVNELAVSDNIEVKLKDGSVHCTVSEVVADG